MVPKMVRFSKLEKLTFSTKVRVALDDGIVFDIVFDEKGIKRDISCVPMFKRFYDTFIPYVVSKPVEK